MSKTIYRSRPAKQILRRMVIDACRRLSSLIPLHRYWYIGFGGLEFRDFDLVHRLLGISRMISIEHDINHRERYEFNRPFRGIELLMGKASEHLPNIDWRGPRIVWLDYESKLSREVLRDSETVARVLRPGSALIVTINASAPPNERLPALEEAVGKTRIPGDVREESLEGWGLARVQRAILLEAVSTVTKARPDDVIPNQIFNFNYRDGQRMQTVGWVFGSEALESSLREKCRFEELEYVRTADQALEIVLPDLTEREIEHLNQRLPLASGGRLKESWLTEQEQEQYAKLYRWYPDLAS